MPLWGKGRQDLISMKMCGKVLSSQLPSSHSKWQRVCTVFSECHHHPISGIYHLFTLSDATMNLAEECQVFIFQEVYHLSLASKMSQSSFLSVFSEEYAGDYLSSFSSLPFPPHDTGQFVIANGLLIIGAFYCSNLTLPSKDRLCCFCINHNGKCFKKLSNNWYTWRNVFI